MKIDMTIERLNKRMSIMNEGESTLVLSNVDLMIEYGRDHLRLKESQLLYIPVGHPYYLISEQPMEIILIRIPENIINAREELFFSCLSLFDLDEKLEKIKAILFLELADGTDQNILEPLFLYMYSKFKNLMTSASVDYILKYYPEKIEIEHLAQLERYNVNYFYKWFRLKYNCSPTAYIRKVRINRAKELLLSSDYGMTDIATKVGFTQLSSFTRSFKEMVGMSPLAYRKCHK